MDLSYWDTIRSMEPDLVIMMGDNVYGRKSSLKEEYQKLKSHASFRRAQDELCILAALDDNDYYHGGGGGGGGATSCESPAEEAVALFQEFFRPTLVSNSGTYQSYQWTDQLQILVLDLRSFSSPRLPGNEPGMHLAPDYHDKTKTWLGKEQWLWLEKELDNNVKLRIIISPLQVLSTGHSFDCWHQLPYERMRLLKLLKSNSNNSNSNNNKRATVLLSGDRHVSALYCQDGQYEITSSSLTHTVPFGGLKDENDVTRQSPFVYENNFGMLELGQDPIRATIVSAHAGEILQQWHLPVA